MDTCGSIAGALKAAMKALVGADTNCLQPPHYLGKSTIKSIDRRISRSEIKRGTLTISNRYVHDKR